MNQQNKILQPMILSKNKRINNILLLIMGMFIISCSTEKKKRPVYVDLNEESTALTSAVEVPFNEYAGVKIVHVKVNGIGWNMIFDTGCSGTLLSLSEARYLAEKGLLVQEDILGLSQSQIADGSIVENMMVNLREVQIPTKDGSYIKCYNVHATVSNNINAPLLLGNEVLDEVATDYTVDNINKMILFNLK